MVYNFDQVIERKNTLSLKYDFSKERGKPEDVLPLWVADMDFMTTNEVISELKKYVELGVYGYSESKEDVLKELSVNRDRGLSSDDVKSRRDKYGLNEFTPMEEGSFWDDLKDALSEPMIVILII